MNPEKTGLGFLFLFVSCSLLAWVMYDHITAAAKRDADAHERGFVNGEDMDDAMKAGFGTDVGKWNSELQRRLDEEQARKAQASRIKAQIDADKAVANEKFEKAVRGALALRQGMKNPDSFKLVSVIEMGDGSLCYTYRGTNSFNAIIPGQAVFTPTKFAATGQGNFVGLWNKHCVGTGRSIDAVDYALSLYAVK